jgi:selenocysteine-specific elongation factor
VLALPTGLRGRVRSLESHGRPVDRSEPGARTAIGIAGIDRASLSRGEVLVTDDLPWSPTTALDVEISLLPDVERALSARSRVRLLHGTSEVMARVLPKTRLEPGGRGLARLRLDRPIVARGEDRFVLRSYSPVGTIGGGRVLDPLPPHRRAQWPAGLASFKPEQRFEALLQRRAAGIPGGLLPLITGLPRRSANEIARQEPSARLLDDLWVSKVVVSDLGDRALALLKAYHRQNPGERGMPLETLRHALRAPAPIVEAALSDCGRAGRLRLSDGRAALAGFAPRVAGGSAEIERIVRVLADAHLRPPSVPELERATGKRDLLTLLRLAAASGQVEAVERDRYYSREALNQFTEVLQEMGQEGSISPAAVRDRLGISRKYLIPLLEWADWKGITVREGEGRRLMTKSRV